MNQSTKDKKQYEVISIAMKYFSELGYEKTKLIDIANDANISTTTLYSFFKTKYKLYESVIEYSLNLINQEHKNIVSKSTTIEEYISKTITSMKEKSESEKSLLNFYMLVTTNSVQLKKHELIEEFEKQKFSYYLKFIKQIKEEDRYILLFIDNIVNIYIYSFFNPFYKEKLLLYLSLYQHGKKINKFEENLLAYLRIWIKKLSE